MGLLPHISGVPKIFAFPSVFSCVPPVDLKNSSGFCIFCFMQLLGDSKDFSHSMEMLCPPLHLLLS